VISNELRLSLDADLRGNRIAGRLYDERGDEHPFSSWLGLLTVLESARRGAGAAVDPSRKPEAH
jgi:hypothetical protein